MGGVMPFINFDKETGRWQSNGAPIEQGESLLITWSDGTKQAGKAEVDSQSVWHIGPSSKPFDKHMVVVRLP